MLNFRFSCPIGIDIGERDVYAAQLKEIRQSFTVRGLLHRELNVDTESTPGASNDLVSVLKEITRDKRFSCKRAVVHIPPSRRANRRGVKSVKKS